MKYRSTNPHQRPIPPPPPGSGQTPQNGRRIAHSRRQPNPPGAPSLLGQNDPGPRPLSSRQRDFQINRLSGRDIIDRAIPPPEAPESPSERSWREGKRRHVRDVETTHIRRRIDREGQVIRYRAPSRKAARNRRHVDRWPELFRSALILLALECAAAILLSPRFRVHHVTVEGNKLVATDKLIADLAVPARQSIATLLTGRMRSRVEAEPEVDSAEVHRGLPDSIRLVVHERTPWASIRLPDASCYIIDRKLVPYRAANVPPANLPKLELLAASDGSIPANVTLGKPLAWPGLASVATCLRWASQNHFPLDSTTIAADGQLCLNRRGGVPVQLGANAGLDRKLAAMSILLDRKPELRLSSDIAYVNLLAPDAPAIMPRAAAAKAKAGESNAPEATPAPVTPADAGETPASPSPEASPAAPAENGEVAVPASGQNPGKTL